MNEGARTNRTGNLMRMLDGDRNRYVALTALPSPEQLSEMLSGCDRLILYFDNPLSIHLFAQGRPAFSKAEQTEKIRRQLDLAVKETGMKLQSRWYYPYPNTAFPVALFRTITCRPWENVMITGITSTGHGLNCLKSGKRWMH